MPHVKFFHNVPILIPILSLQHCLLGVSSISLANIMKEIGFVCFVHCCFLST